MSLDNSVLSSLNRDIQNVLYLLTLGSNLTRYLQLIELSGKLDHLTMEWSNILDASHVGIGYSFQFVGTSATEFKIIIISSNYTLIYLGNHFFTCHRDSPSHVELYES